MKLFMRNALLATAGLVVLSLPAQARGAITPTNTPLFVSKTAQLIREYNGYGHTHDTVAGGVGFQKSKKKKKTATKK
jgi:opacity protein-like surface antigen